MALLTPEESERLGDGLEKTKPNELTDAEWVAVKRALKRDPPYLFDEEEDRADSAPELWRIRFRRQKGRGEHG